MIKIEIINIQNSMQNQQNFYDSIPSDDLNTYQELFSFFDKDDSGSIPISSVPMFIRGLGHCPTQTQMVKILQGFGSPKQTSVSFHELIKFVVNRPKQQMIQQQLADAFYKIQSSMTSSAQAGKNQLMQINYIKKLVEGSGQPFNETEIEAFIDFLNTNDLKVYEQQFNYRNLCKILAYADMQN